MYTGSIVREKTVRLGRGGGRGEGSGREGEGGSMTMDGLGSLLCVFVQCVHHSVKPDSIPYSGTADTLHGLC